MGLNKRALRSALHGHITPTNRNVTMALVEAADILAMPVATTARTLAIAVTEAADVLAMSVDTSGSTAPAFAGGDFLILGEDLTDGPTWLFANKVLLYEWNNPGGDWIDSLGVSQGTTHYATAVMSGFVVQDMTFDVTAGVREQLISGNKGFHVKDRTGESNRISRDVSNGPIPTLTIVTDVDTYPCPLLASLGMDAPHGNPFISTYMAGSMCLRFDYSAVRGIVSSATMVLHVFAVFYEPATFAVNLLDMPTVITDPQRQFPSSIERGWASDLTPTQVRADARALFCPRLDSDAHDLADWSQVNIPPMTRQRITNDGWDAYGLTALRMTGDTLTPSSTILTYHEFMTTADRIGGVGPVLGTTNYDELYVRYMFQIKGNVVTFMDQDGVKMPGFDVSRSTGVLNPADPPSGTYGGGFSIKQEHRRPSPANRNVMKLTSYYYGGGDLLLARYQGADRGFILSTLGALLPDKIYTLEQYVKLNTIRNILTGVTSDDGPTYETDADGIIRIWLDGYRVTGADYENIVINDTIFGLHVGDFFANWYHGGLGGPTGTCNWDMSGVGMSQSYMGPPYPLWRQGLPASVFTAITGTNMQAAGLSASDQTDLWSGFAASDNEIITLGAGGHTSNPVRSWQNGCYGMNLQKALPVFEMRSFGSAFADCHFDASINDDGRPPSSHNYYASQYNRSRNRAMTFTKGTVWGNVAPGNYTVDGYRLIADGALAANDYDASLTFPTAPIPGWDPKAITMARDPSNDNLYIPFVGGSDRFGILKWMNATNTWVELPTSLLSIFCERFSYTGSLVDVARNRLVIRLTGIPTQCGPSNTALGFLDLTTLTTAVSGFPTLPFTTLATGLPAADQYNCLVHDTDNDYYYAMDSSGNLYKVHPVSGATTTVATGLPLPPQGGPANRLFYMSKYKGLIFIPSYSDDFLFMPTS